MSCTIKIRVLQFPIHLVSTVLQNYVSNAYAPTVHVEAYCYEHQIYVRSLPPDKQNLMSQWQVWVDNWLLDATAYLDLQCVRWHESTLIPPGSKKTEFRESRWMRSHLQGTRAQKGLPAILTYVIELYSLRFTHVVTRASGVRAQNEFRRSLWSR